MSDDNRLVIILDDESLAMLIELSEACHCDPCILAASIVRDVIIDDALNHGRIAAGINPLTLN